MPILFQKMIYKADLRANPTVKYLFGDNEQRKGNGGQAKEMRDEPNAVGIRTKAAPGIDGEAYWNEVSEEDFLRFAELIDEDFIPVYHGIIHGHNPRVVIPLDGLGTGLAQLEKRAPCTLSYIEKWIKALKTAGPRPDMWSHYNEWLGKKQSVSA
jgi:hypothetical protein